MLFFGPSFQAAIASGVGSSRTSTPRRLSAMTSPRVPILESIWGTSAGDVYAVGWHGVIVRGSR
jgi:hypothetical protein